MLDVINNVPGAYTFLKMNACKKLRYKIYLKMCFLSLQTHTLRIIANVRPIEPILCCYSFNVQAT